MKSRNKKILDVKREKLLHDLSSLIFDLLQLPKQGKALGTYSAALVENLYALESVNILSPDSADVLLHTHYLALQQKGYKAIKSSQLGFVFTAKPENLSFVVDHVTQSLDDLQSMRELMATAKLKDIQHFYQLVQS